MRSILVLILVAIFLVGAARNRYYGALLYWWFAIFRPQDWIWWDISALRLPLIVAAIFVVPCLLQGIRPRLDHPILVLMVAILGFEVVGFITAGCGLTGDIQMEHLVKLILVVLLTERVLTSKKELFGLIFVAGFSLCFHSADLGLYSLKQGGANFYGAASLTGSFSGSNAFALGSAVFLFFLVVILQSIWGKKDTLLPNWLSGELRRKMCILGLGVFIIGSAYLVISIFSRGSAIAMAIAIFAWCVLQPKRLKIFMVTIPILVLGLAFVPLPEGYEERISSVFAEGDERDRSAASRPHFWKIANEMSDDHLFGVGPGCYKRYYDRYDNTDGFFGVGRSVHSSHFQVLAEAGKFGFAAWLGLIGMTFWQLFKIRKQALIDAHEHDEDRFFFYFSNGMICALLTFVLGGSFYELAHTEIIWLIGLLTVAAARIQQRSDNSKDVTKSAA